LSCLDLDATKWSQFNLVQQDSSIEVNPSLQKLKSKIY